MKRKTVIRTTQYLVIVYCLIGILIYWFQDRILFRPTKLPGDYKFEFSMPHREIMIPLSQTDTINLVQFQPADSLRKGAVLYFHGNLGNIKWYARFIDVFIKNGYEVYMPDYPGYGKSTGELSEENLERIGIETQKLAASKYGTDSIIVYGKSLGTGIASYVAANSTNKELILETPYSSVPNLYQSRAFIFPAARMSNYQLNTLKNLEDVSEPVLIFHGTKDYVIPYSNAAELKGKLKANDAFVTVEGAGHRNLNRTAEYRRIMDSVLTK